MPNPRRSGGMRSIAAPSSLISPLVGGSRPASRLSAVDLPHPDGPRNVTNSPPRTSSAKSSRTVFVPKRFVRRNESAEITLEFLDPLRPHVLVPPIHGRDQIFHRELRDDLVLLLHVGVLGPPVLLDELLDVGGRFVQRRRLDRGPDERLPGEHLLLGPPHEDRKSTSLNSSHRCISYAV